MLAHSIEEWHQVRLMHDLGHAVFSIGAYINPAQPGDDKRPALPEVPFHEDLARAVWATPTPPDNHDTLWAAKNDLPQEVIDWADVFIVHHIEWRWIVGNWSRMRGKRVIWRTVGQSTHENERRMIPYRRDGLQIVRYSPRETAIPYYAGADAIIRFWVDAEELGGWTGRDEVVGNVTQDMRGRGAFCGWSFWQEATEGLRAYPAGPRSDEWGGVGSLTYPGMLEYLRGIRAYLYTGTYPASYTLGLLEAMATGTPVVAATSRRWRDEFPVMPYTADLYEAHELAPLVADTPQEAGALLRELLRDREFAADASARGRRRILDEFALDKVREEWRKFLG